MKNLFIVVVVFGLIVGLFSTAQAKDRLVPSPEGMQAVSQGNASIRVNPFGIANQFQFAGVPNHAYEVLHFVSVNNGPVQLVNAPAFRVVTPVTFLAEERPYTAYSAVQRAQEDLLIEFRNSAVENDDGKMDWYIEVSMSNLSDRELSVCYYAYVDLDLFGTPGNDMASAGPDPAFSGRPSFRIRNSMDRDALFTVTYVPDTAVGPDLIPDRFAMGPYPEVRNRLAQAQSCIDLPNTQSAMTGDFTGAVRYRVTIPPGNNLSCAALMISRLQ
jgi:hypothetical protein